jgi:hypothetical protein
LKEIFSKPVDSPAAATVMLTGFILVWWFDLAGGITSLFGIGAFYLLNYLEFERLPGGWCFRCVSCPECWQLYPR